jgi:hypothetical protein
VSSATAASSVHSTIQVEVDLQQPEINHGPFKAQPSLGVYCSSGHYPVAPSNSVTQYRFKVQSVSPPSPRHQRLQLSVPFKVDYQSHYVLLARTEQA